MSLPSFELKCPKEPQLFQEATPILVFAYYFPPLNASGAQRPFRFVKYLQRHNVRAHVITASPQQPGPAWEHITETDGRETHCWKGRLGTFATVCLQRVLPYNDQLPWISDAYLSAARLVPSMAPAAMLSTSPPVATHAAALGLKLKFGIPWIADFRDPFYANPLRPRKLSRPYEAVLERMIMRHADAVIANTDSAAEMLRRRYPGHQAKIHVIWNGYDPEETLRARPLPKRDYKVLLHAGTIYGARHPGALIASLDRLIQRGRIDPDRVKLRLVGWMEATTDPWTSHPSFIALRNRGCLEYVNEALPLAEALRETAEADYLLLLDLNDTGAAVQVPAKVFQYVQIGRPILSFTNSGSPSDRILSQSGVPYVSVYRDIPEEKIDEHVSAFFQLSSTPRRPSKWFEEEFNAEAQTRTLAALLRRVTSAA